MDRNASFSDLLRLAKNATATTSGYNTVSINDAAIQAKPSNPLVAGVLYSRQLIISYNVVLAVILLGLTIWHWEEKVRRDSRHKKQRNTKGGEDEAGEDTKQIALRSKHENRSISSTGSSGGSSGSSNTIQETVLPKQDKAYGTYTEDTPLLATTEPRRRKPRSKPASLVRSWLMYQPSNIPIINKTLPSNSTTLAVLLFMTLNAFYLFFRAPVTVRSAYILADRAGLLFAANLPLLYILSSKNGPIRFLTGYSYENLNIIHRRTGELLCLLAVVHFAGMLAVWYTILLPSGVTFLKLISIKLVWLGIAAFACYETLYVTSLSSFRQAFYELFLASHIILQLAGLLFLWFHFYSTRVYVGVAMGIFLLDRLLFRLFARRTTIQADLTIHEDGATILLSANWALNQPTSLLPRLFPTSLRSGWKPTEHIFISVPSLPSPSQRLQSHPYTIASAAPTADTDHAWLNLLIRTHNGFTSSLLRYAQSHSSVSVAVDGPYGSLHALEMMHDSDLAVIVAGGSGIAVAYPLLWSLLFDFGCKSRAKEVVLIWVVHDASHVEWLGEERLNELKERGCRIVVPPPTGKAGRPDVGALVKEAFNNNENGRGERVGVVVSGPDAMNRDVRNTCAALVRRGADVKVAVEKFGW